jgi:hypothetical protein
MRKILHLILVQQYYRQNALFIFVILMGAFGFLSATEHLTLIRHALAHPSLMYLVFTVWTVHGIKTTAYAVQALGLKQNEFLHHLHLFSRQKRLWSFFMVQFQLVQLTFLYSLCMMVVSWQEGNLPVGLAGVLFHVLLCGAGAVLMERKCTRPDWRLPRILPRWGVLFPDWSFFPYHLLTQQTVLFFLSKGFSTGILMAVCVLFPTDDYDIRLLGLGAVLAAFSLTVIFQTWIFYEGRYFDFVRNLPLSLSERFLKYAVIVVILVLPECLVFLRNWPLELGWVSFLQVALLMYGVGLGLYFYQRWDGASDNLKPVVYSAIGLCILVMFRMPLALLGVMGALGGFLLFSATYYSEEV